MEVQYFFILLRSDSITFFPSSSCHFFACFVNAFFLDLPLQIIHFIPFLLFATRQGNEHWKEFRFDGNMQNSPEFSAHIHVQNTTNVLYRGNTHCSLWKSEGLIIRLTPDNWGIKDIISREGLTNSCRIGVCSPRTSARRRRF